MNTLEERIQKDLVEAMKAHQENTVAALRLIKTAIQNEKVSGTYHELSDDDIVKIIQKLVKQHQESIDIYTQAGRDELAEKEKLEMDVLQKYLPQMLTHEQLMFEIDTLFYELDVKSMKDMGRLMKALAEKFPNQYDGKSASTYIKNKIETL